MDLSTLLLAKKFGTGGGGGTKPTLFPATYTYPSLNHISWTRNTQNGGFGDTVTATIDGEEVTSPLEITEDIDGKTIYITESAEGFESKTISIELEYTTLTGCIFTRNKNIYQFGKYMPYMYFYYVNGSSGSSYSIGADTSENTVDFKNDVIGKKFYTSDTRFLILYNTGTSGGTITSVVTLGGVTATKTTNTLTNDHYYTASDFPGVNFSHSVDELGLLITLTY